MIVVNVSYTVKQEFVRKNQDNIRSFMIDFKKMDKNDFRYQVYLKEDGRTFVHFSHFKNEEIKKEVLAVPSFKLFQKERDDSGLDGSHKLEVFKMVDTSATVLQVNPL